MVQPTPSSPRIIRFGIFELDPRAGELRKLGMKVKLQEQPFEVLVMLLERPGEVVTREEIQQKLWPADTFVDFEHGINAAVKRLREALDDSADNPRFVETLARRGYRFIYPVAAMSSSPVGGGDVAATATVGAGSGRSGEGKIFPYKSVLLGLVVIVLVTAGAVWYRSSRSVSNPPLPVMKTIPFTSFPGREVDAGFSPDGKQVAFVHLQEIYLQIIGTDSPVRLTRGGSPAWSPDGRHIAVIRGTQDKAEIYLIPALGGPERKLHTLNWGKDFWGWSFVSWSPDGKYLAFPDRELGEKQFSIFLLSIATLKPHRLVSPSALDFYVDQPRFSPEGKTLAFVRSGGFAVQDIYLVSLAGGEPWRLTFDGRWIWGLNWTPDGKYILYSSDRNRGTDCLWKVPVSGGEPERLPVGEDNAYGPAISPDGRRLAYSQKYWETNIYRIAGPCSGGLAGTPLKLISSSRAQTAPQYSPDGRKIAFVSNRTGSYEVWVCDSDGSNTMQLTSMGGTLGGGNPHWSPDGREIAFDARGERNSDIYVISSDGGPPRRLTTDPSHEMVPTWSHDGRWIYFASNRTGSWQVWKMPAKGGRAVQVTQHGGFAALESVDGNSLYYSKSLDVLGSLWKVPVGGGEEEPAIPAAKLYTDLMVPWAVLEDGICFNNEETRALEFFDFATRRITRKASREGSGPWGGTISVSPDGRWILYCQVDRNEEDIMLVENFRW